MTKRSKISAKTSETTTFETAASKQSPTSSTSSATPKRSFEAWRRGRRDVSFWHQQRGSVYRRCYSPNHSRRAELHRRQSNRRSAFQNARRTPTPLPSEGGRYSHHCPGSAWQ